MTLLDQKPSIVDRFPGERKHTLVLIHGMLGGAHSYQRVIEAFQQHWSPWPVVTFLTPEVLGHELPSSPDHGPTRERRLAAHQPNSDHGFEDEVRRLSAWIQQAVASQETDLHLVGYSLGGRLAIGIASSFHAADRGADLRSLTLVGAHPGLSDPRERQQRVLEDERHAEWVEREGMQSFLDYWQGRPIFATQQGLPRLLVEGERAARLKLDPSGIALAFRRLSLGRMPDYRAPLKRLSIPVHCVTGELDSKFTSLAKEVVLACPTAQHHIVPGVGHNVLLEAPHWLGASLSKWIQKGRH